MEYWQRTQVLKPDFLGSKPAPSFTVWMEANYLNVRDITLDKGIFIFRRQK